METEAAAAHDRLSTLVDEVPFLSRASFRLPAFLDPASAWVAHVPFAFWLVETTKPRTFVELGTHTGVSYFAFCEAVDRVATSTTCFAVDTWRGDEQTGFYGEDVYAAVAERNERYAAFSKLVRETFDNAVTSFEDGSIDLLHIDGLHTYEAVRHDFETWLPKLSVHGIVLFHDTHVFEREFGVAVLWRELGRRYPSFKFLHGHGLGVLAVGESTPPPLRALTGLDPSSPECQAVREAYARLGDSLVDRMRIERDLAEVNARNGQVERLQQQLHRERAEARELRFRLIDLEADRTGALLESGRLADELEARTREAVSNEALATMVLASRSWQLTRPLRWANNRARVLQDPVLMQTARRTARRIPGAEQALARHRSRALVRAVEGSGLFDQDWYLAQHPEVRGVVSDPLRHYLTVGWKAGFSPNPCFDSRWYLRELGDLEEQEVEPLTHFVSVGAEEGRDPNRFFSTNLWRLNDAPASGGVVRYLARVIRSIDDPRVLGADDDLITDVHPGRQALKDGDEVCVYAHFDADSVVDPYVVAALRALADAGVKTVFASSCSTLSEAEVDKVREISAVVMTTRNTGRDWGLYHFGLGYVLDQVAPQAVILQNDSVYTLLDIEPMLARIRSSGWNVAGATDSFQQRYHIQSYFLRLDAAALASTLVDEFLHYYVPVQDKRYIINAYEIGFSNRAAAHGLTLGAVWTTRELERRVARLDLIDDRRKLFDRGLAVNPTHHYWDLLVDQQCPFLKVELVRDNPSRVASVTGLQPAIALAAPDAWPSIAAHLARPRARASRKRS